MTCKRDVSFCLAARIKSVLIDFFVVGNYSRSHMRKSFRFDRLRFQIGILHSIDMTRIFYEVQRNEFIEKLIVSRKDWSTQWQYIWCERVGTKKKEFFVDAWFICCFLALLIFINNRRVYLSMNIKICFWLSKSLQCWFYSMINDFVYVLMVLGTRS